MHLFSLRHTPQGQAVLSALLATKYVRRGAYWLNRHAPKGWYRNCLNGGYSRIHTSYSNEGVLGIAFEYCERFADNSGYINEGKVLKHFGLWPFSTEVYRLGFELPWRGFKPFEKTHPQVHVTHILIDLAWAKLLADPPAEWRIPFRHRTALEVEFLNLDFSTGLRSPMREWWQRLRRRFPRLHATSAGR